MPVEPFWAIEEHLAGVRSVGDDHALEGFCAGVAAAIAWSKGEQPGVLTLRLTTSLADVGEAFEYFKRQTEGGDAATNT